MAEIPVSYYNQAGSPTGNIKNKWWEVDKGQKFTSIFDVVKRVSQFQSYRSLNNLRFARLYHNLDLYALQPWRYGRSTSSDTFLSNRVTLNVIKSCVDTVAAKIGGKQKPKPMFLTVDGDYSLQRKAKNLSQFSEGFFESANIYELNTQSFVDACTFGTGALYLYPEESEIKAERVLIEEILVDEIDGRYGCPRQMHRVRMAPRETLIDMFPKYEKQILMAASGVEGEWANNTTADVIKVIESWHLRSGKDQKDGKHVICIANCDLFEEDRDKDYFPFVFQRWTKSLLGFYGTGLAEELIGIQLEINKILRNIQIAQHLMAVPQVWLEASSNVVTAHINNEIGGIKKYTGNPPIFQVPVAMSAEIYQHLENLYQKAYKISGISEMSANQTKPSGVTAAVALRELSDIESERFMLTATRYEQSYMDIAKMAIDMAKDIETAEDGKGKISIKAPGKKFMQEIKWKDIDLKEDQYIMKVWPTSLLPSTPAGKLQKVQEMMQAGFFDREDAISLLDFPDTEAVTSIITASRDDVLKMIDAMLENGKYDPPEPFMNLKLALKLTQSAYIRARMESYSEDRLQLLRNFMDEINAMLQQPASPQMNAMPLAPTDQGGTPTPQLAAPQPAPQSELMPMGGQAVG